VFRPLQGPGAETEIGIALAWRADRETPTTRRFRETVESLAPSPA
jgi:hypothetical protein